MAKVPDTTTSWIASAFAMSNSSGLGVSKPATLKVFQSFFVSLTLPYSVIRDEEVSIIATVFYYESKCLTVSKIRNLFFKNFKCFFVEKFVFVSRTLPYSVIYPRGGSVHCSFSRKRTRLTSPEVWAAVSVLKGLTRPRRSVLFTS